MDKVLVKRSIKCLIAITVIAPLTYVFLNGKLMEFLIGNISNTRASCILYLLYGLLLQIFGLGTVAYAYSIILEEINKKIR